jgi:hypothetical protein
VLGRLGENEGGDGFGYGEGQGAAQGSGAGGTGSEGAEGGGRTAADAAFEAATQAAIEATQAANAAIAAAADADAIAAEIALEASSKQAYEAMAIAAAQTAKSAENVRALVSMIPVVGTVVKAFEFVGKFISDMATAKSQPGYAASQAAATKAVAEAQALAAGAGGDTRVLAEVTKVKNSLANLTAANKESIESAVIKLYQTYAYRNPNSNELAYWSNAFGPTITADEVLAFQQVLYANEPNLRPVAMTTQTASQPSNNLALPIIAAVAGFLIFGS